MVLLLVCVIPTIGLVQAEARAVLVPGSKAAAVFTLASRRTNTPLYTIPPKALTVIGKSCPTGNSAVTDGSSTVDATCTTRAPSAREADRTTRPPDVTRCKPATAAVPPAQPPAPAGKAFTAGNSSEKKSKAVRKQIILVVVVTGPWPLAVKESISHPTWSNTKKNIRLLYRYYNHPFL